MTRKSWSSFCKIDTKCTNITHCCKRNWVVQFKMFPDVEKCSQTAQLLIHLFDGLVRASLILGIISWLLMVWDVHSFWFPNPLCSIFFHSVLGGKSELISAWNFSAFDFSPIRIISGLSGWFVHHFFACVISDSSITLSFVVVVTDSAQWLGLVNFLVFFSFVDVFPSSKFGFSFCLSIFCQVLVFPRRAFVSAMLFHIICFQASGFLFFFFVFMSLCSTRVWLSPYFVDLFNTWMCLNCQQSHWSCSWRL